jgi:hypothetical protein
MAGWLLQGDLTGAGAVAIDMPDPNFDPYEDQVLRRIAYLYSLNPTVTLSVVSSGGNLGTIGSDTRMQAGASTSQTAAQGGFASAANTPNISQVAGGTYARITQTVSSSPPTMPANTDLLRFPLALNPTGGDIQAMDYEDMLEFFIVPAVTYITSGTIDVQAGGAYHISTSSSVSGSTLVSSTPVFIDTRANAAAYTSGGIGETQDQPTTVNNYYLHRVTPAANTPSFMPLYWDTASGEIREMTLAIFDGIFGPMIRNYVVNGSGSNVFDTKIRYNLNGTGNTMGTVMADTRLSGSSTAGYTTRKVSASDYRTQEFPNGTPTTINTYTLKGRLIN